MHQAWSVFGLQANTKRKLDVFNFYLQRSGNAIGWNFSGCCAYLLPRSLNFAGIYLGFLRTYSIADRVSFVRVADPAGRTRCGRCCLCGWRWPGPQVDGARSPEQRGRRGSVLRARGAHGAAGVRGRGPEVNSWRAARPCAGCAAVSRMRGRRGAGRTRQPSERSARRPGAGITGLSLRPTPSSRK